MGFGAPLADTPSRDFSGNPDQKIDVYLGDLHRIGLASYCLPDRAHTMLTSGHCAIENDFAGLRGTTPAKATAHTVSSGVFELISMAYTATGDRWLVDSTANWMSNEVYAAINLHAKAAPYSQLRRPWASPDYAPDPGSTTVDGLQGWPLVQFIGERYGYRAVRGWWEALDDTPITIRALYTALHRLGQDTRVAARWYAMALTLQPGGFKERAIFGKPVFAINKTLTSKSRSTGRWEVTKLGNFASMAMRVAPSKTLRRTQVLRIFRSLPYGSRHSSAMMRIQYADGSHRFQLLKRVTTDVPRFHPSHIRNVVIVTVNDSTSMVDCGDGPPLSCGGYPNFASAHRLQAYLPST